LSQEQVPSLLIQHLPNRLRFTLQQKIARAAQRRGHRHRRIAVLSNQNSRLSALKMISENSLNNLETVRDKQKLLI
jgi:hypothetical protein